MGLTVTSRTSYQTNKNSNLSFGNTLCIIKPERSSMSERIIKEYIEPAGFKVVRRWSGIASRELIEKHYAEHKGKPFFEKLVNHMSGDDITVMELDGGKGDVQRFREFTLKTLRPKFINANEKTYNGFHASDSEESAKRELEVWDAVLEKAREAKAARKAKSKIDTQA